MEHLKINEIWKRQQSSSMFDHNKAISERLRLSEVKISKTVTLLWSALHNNIKPFTESEEIYAHNGLRRC